MLLGKRARGPMRRTTSMTGINMEASGPSDPPENHLAMNGSDAGDADASMSVVVGGLDHGRLMAMVSPRYQRPSPAGGDSGFAMETAPFLLRCGLCGRRLAPSRDIYMYRGDTAFCSQECREQQMKNDERQEKCSMAASKKDNENHRYRSSAAAAATSEA
ncbi:FCS-Like Zinc finger 7-like [Diospyros lotus]|uniref:FCS-Like Zinc finger 7-like n=1 Tax=Diospyros lotus TaxID=55363 RepID=UPI0022502858|nr:FCS-Like Zinc finger 7-like [Diospyros lotus]